MIVNAEGIVLRQRKIANNRRMIVLFTRQYGKLSAGTSINERSRSKSALALRPFTHAEYDLFKGRESYSINSAGVLDSYYSIGEDINRYMTAAAFLEYLEKVLDEGAAMPGLFKLSLDFLGSVSVVKSNADTLLYAFIVKALRMLGVMPEMGCCVNCGKDLEDIQDELMGANMVTSIEPVPEATIAPVLQPELHTDLNSFLSQGINEEKVEAPVETKSDEMHEITSAANVDEGYTKVEKVESFDLNDEKEVEGPVLQRTA